MKRMMKKQRKFVTKKSGGSRIIPEEGIPQSYAELFNRYCKLAERANVEGQFELGMMFFLGQGVPQSDREAAVWFQKAAEQGHAGAQSALVLCMPVGEAPRRKLKNPLHRTIKPLSRESSSGQLTWA